MARRTAPPQVGEVVQLPVKRRTDRASRAQALMREILAEHEADQVLKRAGREAMSLPEQIEKLLDNFEQRLATRELVNDAAKEIAVQAMRLPKAVRCQEVERRMDSMALRLGVDAGVLREAVARDLRISELFHLTPV